MADNQKKRSQWQGIWKRLKRNKLAMVGLIILIVMITISLIAPFFIDYDTQVVKQDIKNKLKPPSKEHLLGTDSMGRDTLSRMIYGSRVSLFIGFFVVGVSLSVGGILGAIAGFYGGKTDHIIMRAMDVLTAIPGMLLAISIVAALGPSFINLMIALSISSVPRYARIVRSSVMSIKGVEFIESARAIGSSDRRIILVHVLPNTFAAVIVQATIGLGGVIVQAAALSFLGLGIMPPKPEWGAMLSEGKDYIRYSPYLVLFPGIAIMMTVLSLNLLGDGLRDSLDPKLKR